MKEFLRELGISFPHGVSEGAQFSLSVGGSLNIEDIDRDALKFNVKDIYAEMGRVIGEYPNLINGAILGYHCSSFEEGILKVQASILRYVTYLAVHRLGLWVEADPSSYAALSVCGVIYDDSHDCFYFNRRPQDSQEEPGAIDAPGGVLNPEDYDPQEIVLATAKNRFRKKLGLEADTLDCLGLMRIFDSTYNLYNFGILGIVNGAVPDMNHNDYFRIPRTSAESQLYDNQDMTSPAKAMLYMALQAI